MLRSIVITALSVFLPNGIQLAIVVGAVDCGNVVAGVVVQVPCT